MRASALDPAPVAARHLSHRYGAVDALIDVSFSLGRETTALVGVNGAGKSTLMRILAGIQCPGSGAVSVAGDDLYGRRSRGRALQGISLMPQLTTFPGNMTVHEVVSYIGWMRGLSRGDAVARAGVVLEEVALGDRAHRRMSSLSGGMIRRVALAQALVGRPEVLLLDEPSTGLDPEQRRIMVNLLRQRQGAVLFSSHVMEDVADVATRVLVLDGGSLLFDGGPDELSRIGAAEATAAPGRSSLENGFVSLLARRGVR